MDSIERRNYVRNQRGFLTPRECQTIHEEFLLREEEVLAIPQGRLKEDIYSGLTRQHRVYNWLSNPRISRLGIPTKIFQQEPFIASDKFDGAMDGYVFKNDSSGIGYYLDELKI